MAISEQPNYYRVLGVTRGASEEEIRKAYKDLTFNLVPEQESHGSDRASLQALREAFAILNNPKTREAYDYLLEVRKTSILPVEEEGKAELTDHEKGYRDRLA